MAIKINTTTPTTVTAPAVQASGVTINTPIKEEVNKDNGTESEKININNTNPNNETVLPYGFRRFFISGG